MLSSAVAPAYLFVIPLNSTRGTVLFSMRLTLIFLGESVEDYSDPDQDAHAHVQEAPRRSQQQQDGLDGEQQRGAEEDAEHAALAPRQTHSTYDAGRNGLQLIASPLVRGYRVDARGADHAGERRQYPHDDEAHHL